MQRFSSAAAPRERAIKGAWRRHMRGSHRETHLPQWLDTAASEVAAAAPLALFPVKAAAPAAWSLQVACVARESRGECKIVSEMAPSRELLSHMQCVEFNLASDIRSISTSFVRGLSPLLSRPS